MIRLQRNNVMVRWICNVKPEDSISAEELFFSRLGIVFLEYDQGKH